MTDMSYTEAVEAARGAVALGPVECHTCRAWVEYAGGAWVGLGSDQLHECEPFLQAPQVAQHSVAALMRNHPWGQRAYDEAAQREGAIRTYRLGDFYPKVQQAHELPEPEPAWVVTTWRVVLAIATLFVAALVVAVVARWANV